MHIPPLARAAAVRRSPVSLPGSLLLAAGLLLSGPGLARPAQAQDDTADSQAVTYTPAEVESRASAFFGGITEGIAETIDRVLVKYGEPNAYIEGGEISGAFLVGVSYGAGTIHAKDGTVAPITWQGPSLGVDLGLDSTRVFMLIYNLQAVDDIYQRFPGVEGQAFAIGGVGVNYMQSEDLVIVPIRAGVGLRLGLGGGYIKFRKEQTFNPF